MIKNNEVPGVVWTCKIDNNIYYCYNTYTDISVNIIWFSLVFGFNNEEQEICSKTAGQGEHIMTEGILCF